MKENSFWDWLINNITKEGYTEPTIESNAPKYKGLVDFFSQHDAEIQNSKLTGS